MVVDVIIPVYRPEREKLTKLIDWLNKQTVKPSHVFFMQTLVEEKKMKKFYRCYKRRKCGDCSD